MTEHQPILYGQYVNILKYSQILEQTKEGQNVEFVDIHHKNNSDWWFFRSVKTIKKSLNRRKNSFFYLESCMVILYRYDRVNVMQIPYTYNTGFYTYHGRIIVIEINCIVNIVNLETSVFHFPRRVCHIFRTVTSNGIKMELGFNSS